MTEEKKKSSKWMGVQTVELYRNELKALFKPFIDEIEEDIRESQEVIEKKAWELLGNEAFDAWNRKQVLEKELSDIEEILRKYNGGSCNYRNSNYGYDDYSYRNRGRNKTQLEDARWQARQLMFGELDELREMESEAIREVTFCESPADVKSLVTSIKRDVDKFTKKYRSARKF